VILLLRVVDHFATENASYEAGLRLQQLSWQMRDSLDRILSRTVGDVRLLSELPQVRLGRDPAETRVVLKNLQRSFPDYAWIGVTDTRGKVIASTQGMLEGKDVSGRPWFGTGKKQLQATDYHPAPLLGKVLPQAADPWRFVDVSGPLLNDDGTVQGVLGVHLSWEWARRRARDLLTPALREYGAEILIVRGDGMVLLGPAGMVEKILSTKSLELARGGHTGSVLEQGQMGIPISPAIATPARRAT
jgi:hypothetical protein